MPGIGCKPRIRPANPSTAWRNARTEELRLRRQHAYECKRCAEATYGTAAWHDAEDRRVRVYDALRQATRRRVAAANPCAGR